MKLRVKKLYEDAKLPSRAHDTDAGYDVYSYDTYRVAPGQTVKLRLGVAVGIPANHCLLMFPRSGLSFSKASIVLANVIDEGYNGEIHCVVMNGKTEEWLIQKGEKVAQMVLTPVTYAEIEEVKELGGGERGDKGFGSTGV